MRTRHRAVLLVLVAALAPGAAGAQRPAPQNPHVRLGDRACTDCHTTTDWRTVRFDHTTTPFRLLGQHRAVPCAGCHDLRDFRGAASACGTCHADPHRGDAGPRCEQCHSETGWHAVGAQNAHARTRLPDLGVHATLRCEDCHRQTGAQQFTSRVTPCVACHRTTFSATTAPSHTALGLSEQCETCHQFTTWDFARFPQHGAFFPIFAGAHAGVWRSCATCHPDATSYKVFVCTTCHAQGETNARHQGIGGYQWQSQACLDCHPTGRSEGFANHDAIFPINSGTHQGKWTACGDCHTDPSTRQVFSCMTGACHPQATTTGVHQGIPGYQYTAAQCYACHPTGQAGTFTQHDQLFFPIYSGTHAGRWNACSDCHNVAGDRSAFTCMSGACHPAAETNAHHLAITGYQYIAAQCYACHPSGTKPAARFRVPIVPRRPPAVSLRAAGAPLQAALRAYEARWVAGGAAGR